MSLAPEHFIDKISYDEFNDFVQRYPAVVPEKLKSLDQARHIDIPAQVEARKVEDDARLEKSELIELVEWKLSHGKFRPSLRKLVRENSDEFVLETTRTAFAQIEDVDAALKTLTKLRGVGPATASLLLSVYDAESIPFFSDELFRWTIYEDKAGHGWDRSIKYNMKEYKQLLESVNKLSARLQDGTDLSISATDVEKVSYVLARDPDGEKTQEGEKRKYEVNPDEAASTEAKPRKKRVKK